MTDNGATDSEAHEPERSDVRAADVSHRGDGAGSPWAVPEEDGPGPRIGRGWLILSALLSALLLAVTGYAASRTVPDILENVGARPQPSSSPTSLGPADDKAGQSCVDDPPSDLEGQGEPPSYAEIVKACIHAVGGGARLELTVAGEIPARMPDANTNMIIGYELRKLGGRATHVSLQASEKGWAAYRSDGLSHEMVSERVTIKDRTITVTLEDAELPQASDMEWKVETSWTRSAGSSADSVSYAVDSAPDSAPNDPSASTSPSTGPNPSTNPSSPRP
ncbi:MAG: hypothetical protein GEU94_09350 [Micromonosporaceae bacterium]|nr:hypothetical protein [Micromonosporaceae bacterium]